MAGKIFINYRREDERATAARIRDRLATIFGEINVFMDVDNLVAGQRFDKELEKALAETDVFLAVIGPRWCDLLAARQASRDRDYVCEEIAGALQRGIVVIPVPIEQTPLPRANALPEDIRDLVLHQKHVVTHEQFGRDIGGLVQAIRFGLDAAQAARVKPVVYPPPSGSTDRPLAWVAALVAVLLFSAYLAYNAKPAHQPVKDHTSVEWVNVNVPNLDVHVPNLNVPNPASFDGHYVRGNAYLAANDNARAIGEYTRAIESDPRDAKAYFNRGLAYYRTNDFRRAIADYNKAIELGPPDADAYYNVGAAYEALGQREDAIRMYRWALDIDAGHKYSWPALTRLGASRWPF